MEKDVGVNRFIISAGQWIDRTNASGMHVRAGKYKGAYAQKVIVFHFAMWLSPEFQIYLVKEFQLLKEDENNRLMLEWNLQRTLVKVNYHIHTDTIKEKLIPNVISTPKPILLNVALFGITDKEWRDANPKLERTNPTCNHRIIGGTF